MEAAGFIVIGGGIAGMSAAAALAKHGRVAVLEAEEALGYHSSGRSATFSHFGIGNPVVRALTAFSRGFFLAPPDGFAEAPLCRTSTALFVASEEMLPALAALRLDMEPFTEALADLTPAEMKQLCPVLSEVVVAGIADDAGLRLDGEALLQGYARAVRSAGGAIQLGARIAAIRREQASWTVSTSNGGQWTAPIVINAAGAWADQIAQVAGVQPLGLEPKRRTIIVIDPPEGPDVRGWPFVKTAVDDFYMLPEAGRLMASPVDEVPSDPCDAQPEDYDIALAAWKVEQYTTLSVTRIAHRWAGLRSFLPDRVPAAGFAPDAPGFFWLAGQGGFGLQTAPAMAAIVESLVAGAPWPAGLEDRGIHAAQLDPARLRAI